VRLRAGLALVAAALAASGCGGGSDNPRGGSAVSLDPSTSDIRRSSVARRRELARLRARRRASAAHADGGSVHRPSIRPLPIAFDARRKAEMRAYAERHYGIGTYELRDPRVIVEHYTDTADARSAFEIFARDVPDSELHELPGTCAHFVVDRDGTIYQLVPLTIMCRHTVGLNYTAIGIEHVGTSDQQVMGDRRQLQASLRLTRWLRCTQGIKVRDVIGHNESLSSPYHHERVASLRSQTHGDMKRATMTRYRSLLAARGC
jgi:hypothetical protein